MKHVLKVLHWMLYKLRDPEHVQFVFALITQVGAIITGVPALEMTLESILVFYTREDAAFKRVAHIVLTGELKTLDDERDDLFVSLKYSILSFLHSHEPDKVAAAKTLDELIRSYKKISRVDYPAETALVRHFLADLAKPEYAAAATLLGFDPVTARLTIVNNTFGTKWTERLVAVGANLQLGNVRQTRPAVNKAIFAFVNTLDALYASNESTTKDPALRAKLTAAINFINEEVHANVNVLANRGKHYPGKAEDLFDPDMQVNAPVVPGPSAPFE